MVGLIKYDLQQRDFMQWGEKIASCIYNKEELLSLSFSTTDPNLHSNLLQLQLYRYAFFFAFILSDSLLFQTYFSTLNKPKLVRLSPDLNEENRISFYFPPHPIMLALQVSETQFRDWFYPSLLLLLLLFFLAAIGHSFGEKVFYEFNCISPPRKNLVWETSFILRHNHLAVNDHNFCSKKNKKKKYVDKLNGRINCWWLLNLFVETLSLQTGYLKGLKTILNYVVFSVLILEMRLWV